MALPAGTRLGPYEILAAIGAGGMGDVYRARDAKLNRDVAIKVLADLSAADPDRIARFEREAQTLASLNHPNIAIIHGFEESTTPTGLVRALVLELVDGQTLGERIAQGPLPLAEALPIARQIAEACEAAHAQGVVHRDLKPANIKLRPDGTVKILDFGIAKLVDPVGGDSPIGARSARSDGVTSDAGRSVRLKPDLTSALTTPAMTMAGMILGTAAYMAPEQARGKTIDKRADIWAFGCVLFEMLTGTRAFGGDDVTDTLAFVITKEPDWNALPPDTPAGIVRLLRRCLAKEPNDRLRDIGDARIEIKEALSAPAAEVADRPIVASPFWSWPRVAAIAAAISIAALLGGSVVWLRTRPPVGRVSRFGLASSATGGVQFSLVDRDIAISPDGDRIAWVGTGGTILVRALDQVEPTLLTGLGTPRGLFFSPNGQSIGFFDGQIALKRIAVAGGPPVVVCRIAASSRGAAWLADDTIVFATNQSGGGLLRVPASGGEPTSLAKPNRERGEAAYLWPEVVTGRQAVLFTIAPTTAGSVDNFQIAVLDLQSGTPRVLLRGGTDAHYLSSGHLVYGAGGTLRATRIDPARLEIVGTPATVLPQVGISSFGAVNFDMASDATLAYVPSGAQLEARSIVWVDREGREEPTKVPRHAYSYARLSPDGTQLALDARDQESDIWLWHFNRETLTRLTFDPAPDRFPVWAADGRRVFFGSDRTGLSNIFSQAVDGTGAPERVTNSSSQQFPMAVSPDGKTLVYRDASPTMALMTVSLDAEHLVRPLLKTAFAHQNAEISPDGRWMAFESNDSGQFEVFVRPFPNVDSGRWQISTKGGIQPLWSRNGQELFYLVPGGGLMGVRVERGASWNASAPTKLMDERFYHGGGSGSGTGRTYDISPDGRRFLMIKQGESNGAAASLIVVQNWGEELRRLTAPK